MRDGFSVKHCSFIVGRHFVICSENGSTMFHLSWPGFFTIVILIIIIRIVYRRIRHCDAVHPVSEKERLIDYELDDSMVRRV